MLPATSFHSYEREAGAEPPGRSDGEVGGVNDALAIPPAVEEFWLGKQNVNYV